MSDDPHDRPNEPNDDRDEEPHWLTTLLSALESLERNDGQLSGRRRGDRTTMDYDISIGSGLDRSIGDSFDSIRSDETEGVSDRPQTRRRRRSPSDSYHLTVNVYDDELVVTADVASAEPEDVTVGFDDSTLVIAVSGSELDRIDVPWDDKTADATIKNGVLTVTVEPVSEPETDSESTVGDER